MMNVLRRRANPTSTAAFAVSSAASVFLITVSGNSSEEEGAPSQCESPPAQRAAADDYGVPSRWFRARSFHPSMSMPRSMLADYRSVRGFKIIGASDDSPKGSRSDASMTIEVGVCVAQNGRAYQEDGWAALGKSIHPPLPGEGEGLDLSSQQRRGWIWWPWNSQKVSPNCSTEGTNRSALEADPAAVVAVFDGHGGDACSLHASERFQSIFVKELQKENEVVDKAQFGTRTKSPLMSALEGTLLELDRTFTSRMLNPNMVGPAAPPHEMNALQFCGSTAVAVAVDLDRGLLVCSNVGDSRALLLRGEALEGKSGVLRPIPLSGDHSPSVRPDEVERIEKLGGEVRSNPWEKAMVNAAGGNVKGCLRVYHSNGVGGLNMTRALGDVYLKPLVIPNPESTLNLIRKEGKNRTDDHPSFLVLATDGIWDVLPNEKVAELAQNIYSLYAHNEAQGPIDYSNVVQSMSLNLVQMAQRAGTRDNITCMVLHLP